VSALQRQTGNVDNDNGLVTGDSIAKQLRSAGCLNVKSGGTHSYHRILMVYESGIETRQEVSSPMPKVRFNLSMRLYHRYFPQNPF